jgi:hypothetical protein
LGFATGPSAFLKSEAANSLHSRRNSLWFAKAAKQSSTVHAIPQTRLMQRLTLSILPLIVLAFLAKKLCPPLRLAISMADIFFRMRSSSLWR